MSALLPARLWEKVDASGDCWEWLGALDGKGYGLFRNPGGSSRAHRVVFEAASGPVPAGMVLDHLCRRRACVNPEHLEIVTPEENTRRGRSGVFQRSRTHCPQGHPYDEANTRVLSGGRRGCVTCIRAATLAWYHRTKRLKGRR